MPIHFFTFAWPIAFAIIILAGLIVICAACATLVAAITRSRQFGKERSLQATDGENP